MQNTYTLPLLYKQCRSHKTLSSFCRWSSSSTKKDVITTAITDKVTSAVNYFDRVLGIAEVRAAQSVVTQAEDEFMDSRRNVQESRIKLAQLQNQLRELRSKLDRIPREDERYLQLATEEHKVLIDERKLKADLEAFIGLERDNFAELSGAVRNAHEKERSRAERTKYWSIIGSACGAVLGILGSTVINFKRMKQIKLTVQENNQAFITKTLEELQTIVQSNHEMSDSSVHSPGNDIVLSHKEAGDESVTSPEIEKLLDDIHRKVDELSHADLPLLIQQLKDEILKKRKSEVNLTPLADNVLDGMCLGFEKDMSKIIWWSKAGIAVSLMSSLLFLIFR